MSLRFFGRRKIPFSPTLALRRSGPQTLLPHGQREKVPMRRRGCRGSRGAEGVAAISPGCLQRRRLTILQIRLMHLEYTGGKKCLVIHKNITKSHVQAKHTQHCNNNVRIYIRN